jgi:serine/threonine-protein kinase
MRGSGDLTQTGTLLGSPKYMSPEQVIGKRADQRSDIFSLGVILYEMLCGTAPFNGENVTALMYQIVNFVPPAPSSINSAVPPMLDLIVAKMLAKPLEGRYQDAAELARDLRECERSLEVPSGSTQPPRTVPGLAAAPQPTLVDAEARTVMLAQTLNRTRVADQAPENVPDSPARGIAQSFDSIEATQRLATLTGAALKPEEAPPPTTTQVLRSISQPPRRKAWRRRDWLLVGAAALGGLLVAGGIVRRRK